MKKILLICILLLNIRPSFDNATLQIRPIQYVEAQTNCYNMGNPTSGGSFWGWLGNVLSNVGTAIGNVFTAIGNFFTSGPGESASGEDGDDDWTPGGSGDEWIPDPQTYDPWNDPYFTNYGFDPTEWNLLIDLGDYYNTYVSTGGNYTTTTTPNNPKYYIQTSANMQERYYDGDTMYVSRQEMMGMVFKNENSPYTVNIQDTKWKRDDTTKAVVAYWCQIDVNQPATSIIKIDSADITTLIHTNLVVYQKPTIVFERGDNYGGEYGFDDSSHKFSSITSTTRFQPGTETTTINGSSYVVPWMSLLDDQTATINVKKLNLTNAVKRDPTFKVSLKPSSDSITLNGLPSLDNLTAQQLDNLNTLTVSSNQWNDDAENLKIIGSVYAITNLGDTIGKLNLSCAKPKEKYVVFVYVNTGNGYLSKTTGTHSKLAILEQLNQHSHNQIMRKWVLDEAYNNYDTIDLTTEYNADTALFHNSLSILNHMPTFFHDHKGIYFTEFSPDGTGNRDTRRHVVFLFNYAANANTNGQTDLGGVKSVLFSTSTKLTATHEIGHILHLDHMKEPPYNLPEFSTVNFMDYWPYNNVVDGRIMFLL